MDFVASVVGFLMALCHLTWRVKGGKLELVFDTRARTPKRTTRGFGDAKKKSLSFLDSKIPSDPSRFFRLVLILMRKANKITVFI